MKNTIVKNSGNVVAINAIKNPFISLNEVSVKDANVALVESYLKQLDWKVNENSNMAYSIQGLNNYIASETVSYTHLTLPTKA